MKKLLPLSMLLFLLACSQQDFTEDELKQSNVQMLKYMCENRQSCLDHIDLAFETCETSQAKSIGDNFSQAIDNPKIEASVALQLCIFEYMDANKDEAFLAQFDKIFPVAETEVKITKAYETDAEILQVKENNGKLDVLDQTIEVSELMTFIVDNKLTETHHSAVFITDEDIDLGIMLTVNQDLNAAGFDKVSIDVILDHQ